MQLSMQAILQFGDTAYRYLVRTFKQFLCLRLRFRSNLFSAAACSEKGCVLRECPPFLN